MWHQATQRTTCHDFLWNRTRAAMTGTLEGILPAIASPCDDKGLFLEDAFASLAERLYRQGVHGLYVGGSTGDAHGMEPGDRKRAVEIAVEISRNHNGRVIAHVGASERHDAVELAEHAAMAGSDAVSSLPPANHDHAQLLGYYDELSRAAQRPLILYYIPILSGQRMTAGEMEALLDVNGVIGFKNSDWDLFTMSRVLRRRPDALFYNGNDEFLFPGLLYGARGGIGMNHNFFPRLFLGIYESVRRQDLQHALELQRLFLAYADVFFKYGGIRPNFEALMRELNLAPNVWRGYRPVQDQGTDRRFLAEVMPKIQAIEDSVGEVTRGTMSD